MTAYKNRINIITVGLIHNFTGMISCRENAEKMTNSIVVNNKTKPYRS